MTMNIDLNDPYTLPTLFGLALLIGVLVLEWRRRLKDRHPRPLQVEFRRRGRTRRAAPNLTIWDRGASPVTRRKELGRPGDLLLAISATSIDIQFNILQSSE
jgi:hypothetical protein